MFTAGEKRALGIALAFFLLGLLLKYIPAWQARIGPINGPIPKPLSNLNSTINSNSASSLSRHSRQNEAELHNSNAAEVQFLDPSPSSASYISDPSAKSEENPNEQVEKDPLATPGDSLLSTRSNIKIKPGERDLNEASEQDLLQIKGVGPKLAQALLIAKKQRGRFTSWNQVDAVKGVGKKKLQAIQSEFSLGHSAKPLNHKSLETE